MSLCAEQYERRSVEIIIILFFLIMFGIIVFVSMTDDTSPNKSAAGRWGIKAGKIVRGEFGGKKWGEDE